MNSEILQKYKDNQISLDEVIEKLKTDDDQNIKNNGVIYTPPEIIQYMLDEIKYSPEKTVLEPSVGHGNFIFGLIHYVEKHFQIKGDELKKWFEDKIYCFDINKKTIDELKQLLTLFFKKKGIDKVDFKNIKIADPLFHHFDRTFDVAIGNPPYIRSKNIPKKYLEKIKSNYSSCKSGNVDLFYAFMELTYNIATESTFIVPNSYIINSSAKRLRKLIKQDLKNVIDFKHQQIFKDVKTYTSIYHINKSEKNNDNIQYKEKLSDNYIEINKSELNDDRWILTTHLKDSKNDRKSILSFCDNVYASIATLRDNLYIINNAVEKNGFYVQPYQGKNFLIEKGICVDYYKPTKPDRQSKIIFPYLNNKIMDEKLLIQNYPMAYQYLLAIKNELMKRDKSKTESYEAWYAYGRKQAINERKEIYVLLLPMMANKNFQCEIKICPDMYLLTAGFALAFYSISALQKVKKHLESDDFFNYIKQCGKVWAGDPPYYSFSKTQLKNYCI